jgi:hypothetical protein
LFGSPGCAQARKPADEQFLGKPLPEYNVASRGLLSSIHAGGEWNYKVELQSRIAKAIRASQVASRSAIHATEAPAFASNYRPADLAY